MLDGIVEVVIGEVIAAVDEIEPLTDADGWKAACARGSSRPARSCCATAGRPTCWSRGPTCPPSLVPYFDAVLGLMREAGFSLDLAHHAMHALGTRTLGFTRELFVTQDKDVDPERRGRDAPADGRPLPPPGRADARGQPRHRVDLGERCDDQSEFEFGLDLVLDGLERLRADAWSLPSAS